MSLVLVKADKGWFAGDVDLEPACSTIQRLFQPSGGA
jgi:hypothetical protein